MLTEYFKIFFVNWIGNILQPNHKKTGPGCPANHLLVSVEVGRANLECNVDEPIHRCEKVIWSGHVCVPIPMSFVIVFYDGCFVCISIRIQYPLAAVRSRQYIMNMCQIWSDDVSRLNDWKKKLCSTNHEFCQLDSLLQTFCSSQFYSSPSQGIIYWNWLRPL